MNDQIVKLLESHGMNPIYVSTVFMIAASLYEYRNLRKDKNLSPESKGWIKSIFFATAVCIFVSVIWFFTH